MESRLNNKENWKCSLCGDYFIGRGNNPEPVKPSGRCCTGCNESVVIPARLRARKCNHCGGDMSEVDEVDAEVCPRCEPIAREEYLAQDRDCWGGKDE